MPGQADAKRAALAASRTLNSDPRNVTDPAFTVGGFFDPADLLQVKYEMVRAGRGGRGAGADGGQGIRVRPAERLQRPVGAGRGRAGRADPGQAGSPRGPQAHRGGARPPGGPARAGSPGSATTTWPRRPPNGSPLPCIPAGPPGTGQTGRQPPGQRQPWTGGTQKPPTPASGAGAAAPSPAPLPKARADPASQRYEALRAIVVAGSGGGWRYELPVLAASGLAAWLAQGPAAGGPGAGASDPEPRAAMPRAAQSPLLRPRPCPAPASPERR